jgi:hypothetical protein
VIGINDRIVVVKIIVVKSHIVSIYQRKQKSIYLDNFPLLPPSLSPFLPSFKYILPSLFLMLYSATSFEFHSQAININLRMSILDMVIPLIFSRKPMFTSIGTTFQRAIKLLRPQTMVLSMTPELVGATERLLTDRAGKTSRRICDRGAIGD